MKLRNKKTGETVIKHIAIKGNNEVAKIYNSLAELNEEWEDYEEPKDFWFINGLGDVIRAVYKTDEFTSSLIAIGNHFETPEEADKAVEKLKAWKRLKDKGFRFDKVNGCWIEFTLKPATSDEDYKQGQKDLLLLFRGEE